MFSKSQNHHKSHPKPNFAIIPNSFDIKKRPTPQHPQNSPKIIKFNLEIITNIQKMKMWSPTRKTRSSSRETRSSFAANPPEKLDCIEYDI